jgi:hypothetical protein
MQLAKAHKERDMLVKRVNKLRIEVQRMKINEWLTADKLRGEEERLLQ